MADHFGRVKHAANIVPTHCRRNLICLRAAVELSLSAIARNACSTSGGGAWVAAMRVPSMSPGHKMIGEIQEGLPAQEWRRDPDRSYRDRLRGPVVLVGLSHPKVNTSAGYDWPLQHRLCRDRIVDDSGAVIGGRPWQLTSANLGDKVDQDNWKDIVAAGDPKWIGKGYGMATAKTHAVCASGARLQLSPHSTLAEIDAVLQGLQQLVRDMARVGTA